MTIKFKNTTTEQLFEVRPKFFDVLINHLAEGIDMERMKLVLQNMESHVSFFFFSFFSILGFYF